MTRLYRLIPAVIIRPLVLLLFVLTGVANGLAGQTVTALSGTALSGQVMDVYFLDVAQGNCILIKLPNGKFMLYDAGTSSSKIDANVIAAKINAITGGTDITTIFLSHPDKDHISLIPSIREARRPQYVHFSGAISNYTGLLGTWLASLPTATRKVTYKTYYHNTSPTKDIDGDTLIDVYVIAANVPGDPNTQSLVISVDYNSNNVLLTGDATAVTERWILGRWSSGALRSTVLSFGHHGSNHSSSRAFVMAVKPNVGVFSASAEHLGYGHPRCVLVDSVETMVDMGGRDGITIPMHRIDCWNANRGQYVTEENNLGVFLTATQGNIRFSTDGYDYKVLVDRLR
ncbi:MAG TPA: MBL fold metallo-hydrolase [Chitinophaga sp.]